MLGIRAHAQNLIDNMTLSSIDAGLPDAPKMILDAKTNKLSEKRRSELLAWLKECYNGLKDSPVGGRFTDDSRTRCLVKVSRWIHEVKHLPVDQS